MRNSARVLRRPLALLVLGALVGLAANGCSSTSATSFNRLKAQSYGVATQRGPFTFYANETKREADRAVQRALFDAMRARGFSYSDDVNTAKFIVTYEYKFERESIAPLEANVNFSGAPGGGTGTSVGTTSVTHFSISVYKFHTVGATRDVAPFWQAIAAVEDPTQDVVATASWLIPAVFQHFGRTIDPEIRLERPAHAIQRERRDPKLPKYLD